MDSFIDFSFLDGVEENAKKTTIKKETDDNLYEEKKYDETTMQFYRVLRKNKYNVISQEKIDHMKAFEFKYQWDPYTGEILYDDPYGSLYFHPDDLIRYFDLNKLNGLWNEAKDETGGYYQGYYGEHVGCGYDMEIVGRGAYKELYLFRLPITDCYLTPDHSLSIPTMGPVLTDEDVKKIDELAEKYYKDNYIKTYRKKRPSLLKMKYYYDQAISKNPDISLAAHAKKQNDKIENDEKTRNMANRVAVDMLKKM